MKLFRILSLTLCGLLLLSSAWTQTETTGQITGQVTDPSGAAVVGAEVVLTSAAGWQRNTSSNPTGHYKFPLLPPGPYRLQASASGFGTVSTENVRVLITETTEVNLQLPVGSREETVMVTAEAPLVQSENPTTGKVIQEETIRQLPLATRNFQQLLTLTTGTSGALPNSSDLGRGDAVFNVNGQRSISNSMVINGVDANSIGTGSTPNLAVPTTDSLQEFKVQTSLYDASQGRNTGGVVAVVTKSGTNEWHGNAFYFIRNDSLNANNYFLNRQGVERPTYDRDQFGGTLGGPLMKDRAWFFVSYQGTREDNGTSLSNSLATVFVPGNLSDDRSPAALAALSASFGLGGFVHPTAAALLQAQLPNGQFLIPSAPSPGASNASVATAIPSTSTFDEDQANANLDLQISQSNRLSGKFFWANNDIQQALFNSFGTGNPLQLPGFSAFSTFRQRVVSADDTHIFSPTLLNVARFGYSIITTSAEPAQPFTAAEFGISSPLSSLFPEMPTISISNFMDIGPSPFEDNDAQVATYTVSDTLTWTKGRHTFKLGGEYKRQLVDLRFDLYTRGNIFHLGFLGNPFTDFLAGLSGLSIMGSGVNDREQRANDAAWFVQDDWRLTNRLTVNLGLRWDYFGPFYELQGRYIGLDPARIQTAALPTGGVAITDGFVQAGNATNPLPGIPLVEDGLVESDWNNLAPRVGFALELFKSKPTVLRGGYGVYYDRPNARLLNNQVLNFPYYTLALVFATPITNPFVQVPLPDQFPLDVTNPAIFPFGGPPAVLPAAVAGGLTFVPSNGLYPNLANFRTPYVQQYNLGIQHELLPDLLLDIAYVGSAGRKLMRLRSLNQAILPGAVFPLALTAPLSPGLSDLPAQGFGTHVMESSSNSFYNSLQVGVTKRMSNGLQFLAAYTWAHSNDDFSGTDTSDNVVVPGDQVNLNNRATSDFDRRHRFVFSSIYDLPKLYHGTSRAMDWTVNNWQIAGILTLQTGTPFSLLTNANAFTQARADFAPGCTADSAALDGDVTARLNAYFDTSCFTAAAPIPGNFGTTGRNILRGPDQRNLDFSIVKFFPIDERKNIEFRTEFFNITNTPSFATPVNIRASGNFGQIVRTSTGPRVIQFALKFAF